MERKAYNFFVESDGVGEGPTAFRITDVHGHELVIESVNPGDDIAVETDAQLPACEDVSEPTGVESSLRLDLGRYGASAAPNDQRSTSQTRR